MQRQHATTHIFVATRIATGQLETQDHRADASDTHGTRALVPLERVAPSTQSAMNSAFSGRK